ncbi:Arginine--tRNA ligase [subsurface metagenome]
MVELAREIADQKGDKFRNLPEAEAIEQLGQVGLEKMIGQIKADLELMGVTFDVWFNESSLYKNGQYDDVMSLLKQGGHISEKEGATWFVTTALGEDKDNVVIRSD